MGLLGILAGLGLLVFLAFRGWSVLLLAPVAALIAACFAGEPLLAHWTQTFMGSASASSRSSFRCSCSARSSAS
jgi:H+/gluconate symporter-like permease